MTGSSRLKFRPNYATIQAACVYLACWLPYHANLENVQQYGCVVLANLACNSNNRVVVADKSGIEEVLAALNAHRSSENVQHYGCRALSNLADNSNNQTAIVGKGGIEAAVAALNAHRSSENAQRWGGLALTNLACRKMGHRFAYTKQNATAKSKADLN